MTKDKFAAEINSAHDDAGKIAVARKYAGAVWDVEIPTLDVSGVKAILTVGDLEGSNWTYTPQGGTLQGIKVAAVGARMGKTISVRARPVVDEAESKRLGGAYIVLEAI